MDDIDIDFDMADFEVDVNLDAFEIDLGEKPEFETGLIKPRLRPEIKKKNLKYKNAQKLAKDVGTEKGLRAFCVVDGTFIFGDFIEAWITENKLFIRNMYISTLSMSLENIASLKNLLKWNCVKNLNLIVSAYFFSHERYNLVQLMYDEFEEYGDRFQLGVASSHCKTVSMETHDGRYFNIHGSANLRSSSNLEQFVIEECPELYNFTISYQSRIIELYKTIDHQVRRNKLWQAVQGVLSDTTEK
jgi:hypothetical protein